MKKNKSNELANKNYNQRKIEKDILPIPNLKNYINHINDDNSFPKKK